ncbi:PQ loop repeat-domain-containing protein [Pseudomassariella vexata]|uniref:PQ loop repeat-domain-containing protein n=1 Tax=Pseudomassariella vexata TaxID=1141098 RepID=A0A1Y2EFT5_9PEZI|nr:PQ loop repeat-domain-containing protein [Pseudomassariella vexata]ORY70116.1 PQ loop repeat-domain-containing protein [Pseudomassariella vexata]
MAPPTAPLNLDVEAISGICGSISIAAWVVVFSPQIIENFRRSSADGLSLHFIIVWLAGDVFNILGAVLQGVLPTMLILAIYYTIADVVLLAQCFYYKGFTWKDEVVPPPPKAPHIVVTGEPNERTGLLDGPFAERGRRDSRDSWSHLSPAVPLVSEHPAILPPTPTRLQATLWNTTAVLMVCVAGVAGWVLSRRYSDGSSDEPAEEGLRQFNIWGQIFGYMCAVLYLGSRVPQMILNWRRKSTEGVSMLFFLFACLGNLTYVLSIFAYEPRCAQPYQCHDGEAKSIYGRYILVNLSWLAGSLGTLFLDLGIFAQFFIYSTDASSVCDEEALEEDQLDEDDDSSIDEDGGDQRPVLQRLGSGLP